MIEARLSISGRVTMKGLSRWRGPGGRYRTIQRLFTTSLHGCQRNWLLIRHHLLAVHDVIVMSGDHVVVTQAGKTPYGLDRFFSSLYGKAVPGLCCLSVSLLSVKRRTSSPVVTEQVEKPGEASGQTPPQQQPSGWRGRPTGRKHRQRRAVALRPSLCFIPAHLQRLLEQIGEACKVVYFIFDGAFGHNDALQRVRPVGLHLLSKLRYTSALYLPYDGPDSGRGPRRTYGQKLDYQHMPSAYLQATSIAKEIQTQLSQLSLWHKKVADVLHIVVSVQTNLHTKTMAHVVLFSSDVSLGYAQVIDSYRWRFPLEFNFRDAKQYWGLEDFMRVKARPVYNSANLAMCMVNVSQALLRPMRAQWPAFSVNDLKAWFRGQQYVVATLPLLPEPPDSMFIDQVVAHMAALGRINHAVNPA